MTTKPNDVDSNLVSFNCFPTAKTCASISNQVFTVFVAELFPTDIRNSALGTGNTFGRLGALCGSLLVNSPVLAHWDLAALGLTFLG